MDTFRNHSSISRRMALKLLVGAGAFLAVPHTGAFGETEEELREKAAQTQTQLDSVQRDYEDAKSRLEALAAEFQALSIEQGKTLDQIYDVEANIGDIEVQIGDTQAEIDQKEAELGTKQERLSKRISSSYKSGGTDLLSVLMSSATFDDLVSNIYYLDKVTANDAKLIAEVRTIREGLAQQKTVLESDRAELEVKRAELEELDRQQSAQIESVRAKQGEISGIIAGLSEQVRTLMAQHDAELLAADREAQRAREAAAAAAAQAEVAARAEAAAAAAANAANEADAAAAAEAAAAAQAAAEAAEGAAAAAVDVSPVYERADVSNLVQGAGGLLQAVINATYSVPSPGAGYCAWWVTDVFDTAGVGSFGGNACDMYYAWCYSSDRSAIKPGMIIAVSTYPTTGLGAIYGHVGIYIGDGTIRENIGYINTNTLDNWIAWYSGSVTVRWGWIGGVVLA